MAVKETHNSYSNYQERDYNAEYDLLAPRPELNPHTVDTDRLTLNPDDRLPDWHSAADLCGVLNMTFRYRLHKTSNTNARDRLRYGSCETEFDRMIMWGFETVQEFRDHLAVRDKAWAQQVWAETSCELRNESIKYLFWVPKNTQHTTVPGAWAITMDRTENRTALIWCNQALTGYSNLKLAAQNKIWIRPEH
jgi:hypothetical protein